MGKTFKLSNIIYDISYEELDIQEEDFDSYFEWAELCDKKIKEIESSLPSELIVSLDDYSEDSFLDDLAEEISTETGWLIHSFCYEEIM